MDQAKRYELLAKAMSETELQGLVIDAAVQLKMLQYHTLPSQRQSGRWVTAATSKGFPDLILAGHSRLLAVELKTMKGKPTAEQLEWLARFEASGVETYIWRPIDWLDGSIIKVLRAQGRQ